MTLTKEDAQSLLNLLVRLTATPPVPIQFTEVEAIAVIKQKLLAMVNAPEPSKPNAAPDALNML